MSDENMETNESNTNATDKTFTQAELEKVVSDRLARERRKHEKELDGLDLTEARQAIEDRKVAEQEVLARRGEFEKILKQTAEEHKKEVEGLRSIIQTKEVDGALLSAASTSNAISPEQITQLLKGQVRLSSDGVAEVLDNNSQVRYNKDGSLFNIGDLVGEFLTANSHFVRAGQGGTGSTGNAGGNNDTAIKKSREEFEQLNPVERANFLKNGGSLI
jgi:hypothetical protein